MALRQNTLHLQRPHVPILDAILHLELDRHPPKADYGARHPTRIPCVTSDRLSLVIASNLRIFGGLRGMLWGGVITSSYAVFLGFLPEG